MPAHGTSKDVIPLDAVAQLQKARQIIRDEAEALQKTADRLNGTFCDAVRLIEKCCGCLIVTGVGKAGLIGQKIVATLGSTGTRSWFLHPTEAVHGDLGCVHDDDVVLAISNSGRSEEVLRLLPVLADRRIPVIALTRDSQNVLARAAAVTICIGRHEEAGDLGLAPTTSTAAMLAVGDALALTLSQARGFTAEDFARCHPAGSLGRQLQSVCDVMRTGDALRVARADHSVRSVLVEQQRPGRRTGAILLVDATGRLQGIFTDSDLVRLFEQHRESQLDRPVSEVMTRQPCTISHRALLPQALEILSARKLSELPVVDDGGRPVGIIDVTDVIDQPLSEEQLLPVSDRRTA